MMQWEQMARWVKGFARDEDLWYGKMTDDGIALIIRLRIIHEDKLLSDSNDVFGKGSVSSDSSWRVGVDILDYYHSLHRYQI